MDTLATLSKEQGYQMFSNQDMVGEKFRIDHLTSERGRTMNGKICRAVSFTPNFRANPDMRLGCKIQEDDGSELSTPISFKCCNLVRLEANIMQHLCRTSKPLSDEEIMKGLRQGLAEHETTGNARADLSHRINLYKNVLKKLEDAPEQSRNENGNALEDEQYCFPCGASPHIPVDNETTFDWLMRINKPACVGNNKMDLRLMDLGLKGDGVATCDICTNALDISETRLVTLPCVHQFHTACLEQWLSSDLGRRNWNCPTCRQIVPKQLGTYMIQYDVELQNRFKEFLLTGFCQKCILWVMERDRNQELPAINQSGEQLTMNQVGQMQDRVYIRPPP